MLLEISENLAKVIAYSLANSGSDAIAEFNSAVAAAKSIANKQSPERYLDE